MRLRRVTTTWQMSTVSIAATVGLSLVTTTCDLAYAQTPAISQGNTISLGDRGWSAAETGRIAPANDVEFSARAGFASDYIYRGTTLSNHEPAAGAAIEARFGQLYAGSTAASVKLPTQPLAEVTMTGGYRPKLGNFDFDLGVTYFAYPGERLPGVTGGINYWEAGARGGTRIGESIRVAAGYAYSPNLEYRRLEPICGGRSGLRLAEPASPTGFRHSLHDRSRILLVRLSGCRSGRLQITCLPKLAGWRNLHLQDLQSRSAILRHEFIKGRLLRLHRRSQRATRWPH